MNLKRKFYQPSDVPRSVGSFSDTSEFDRLDIGEKNNHLKVGTLVLKINSVRLSELTKPRNWNLDNGHGKKHPSKLYQFENV